MVIKMKKQNKGLTKNAKTAIMVVVIAIFLVIISIAMRQASYTQTWLVCEINHTTQYNEVLKFRFDINDKFYGYYREEKLYNMDEQTLEANYQEKRAEEDRVHEELSDNFQYEVVKENNELHVKTYIGVSVFPNFFNNYIGSQSSSIRSTSSVDDIKNFLEANNYKCSVSRK